MNPTERRLAALLQAATPEPRRAITIQDIESRVHQREAVMGLSHRWRVPLLAAACVVAIVALAAAATAVLHPKRSAQPGPPGPSVTVSATAPATSASASGSASPSAKATTSAATVGPCRAAQLIGKQTDGGSQASQPWRIIALTNVSASTCYLSGYPDLSARGHAEADTSGTTTSLSIAIRLGIVYGNTDPGPVRIDLAPHSAASFAVGTGMAYQGGAHPIDITELRIALPDNGGSVRVAVALPATAPAGQPIPVGVTGLVAGTAGPRIP
jgi:hypothetical protein